MNILHLSTPNTWRGGEQQVYWLFEGIEAQKTHDQVLVSPENSELLKKSNAKKWNTIALKNSHHFNPFSIRTLVKICRSNKIDLLHLHDAHALNMGILANTLFGLQRPLVFTRRVDFPLKKNWFTRFKYNHSSLKKIICVSSTIKDIIKNDIKELNKITSVHSGVDIHRFPSKQEAIEAYNFKKALKLTSDTILIGNASALSDHKDLITFVKVADHLLKQTDIPVHFVIMGEGKERSAIEHQIHSMNLKKYITLTGFRNDINIVLPQLDIFLMTSVEEGLGTTVLDAMAAGVPVVSTNAGGLKESVIHEKTGLLTNVKDVELLSAHLLKLMTNKAYAEKISTNAKKNVTQNFSKQNMVEGVLKVYDSIL